MSCEPVRASERPGREGTAMIMVTVAIAALLSFAALGIDLAMVTTTRTELQNAADAAALAGASGLATGSQSEARSRAIAFAGYNNAVLDRHRPVVITATDITFPASNEIRVVTHRTAATGDALRVHFQRLFALERTNTTDVRATATARVSGVCATDCLKPWAIPDRWSDTDGDSEYDPGEPYDPIGTGYRAPADVGLRVTLYVGNPHQTMAPGQYYPVDFPPLGGAQNPITGGDAYREWIASCSPYPVAVGDSLQLEPGAMAGPTGQGVDDLIALDPGAYWDTSCDCVRGSAFGRSPRTVIVPLFDPRLPPDSGRQYVKVAKIGAFFLEGATGGGRVTGRFMQIAVPATPCASGTPTGGLVTSFALIR